MTHHLSYDLFHRLMKRRWSRDLSRRPTIYRPKSLHRSNYGRSHHH
jgi:hypothetical protein